MYRQMAVRPFKQADSQLLLLLLRGKRMNSNMGLVWLTISKALEKSIAYIYYVQEGGEAETAEWLGAMLVG